MSRPPRVSSKRIEFPDPDDYESMKVIQKRLRKAILDLRPTIGNDGALEGRLVDTLRFIGHTPLNKQDVADMMAGRAMSVKHNNSWGSSYADCLYFFVLTTVNEWHKWADPRPEGVVIKLTQYLDKLEAIAEKGLRTFPVCGDEVKGYWLGD